VRLTLWSIATLFMARAIMSILAKAGHLIVDTSPDWVVRTELMFSVLGSLRRKSLEQSFLVSKAGLLL
jgi:hypothetical protein